MTTHRICIPLGRTLTLSQFSEAVVRTLEALDEAECVLRERLGGLLASTAEAQVRACRDGLCLQRTLEEMQGTQDTQADAGDRRSAVAASAGGPACALPQGGTAGPDAPVCIASPHYDDAGLPLFVDGRAR